MDMASAAEYLGETEMESATSPHCMGEGHGPCKGDRS